MISYKLLKYLKIIFYEFLQVKLWNTQTGFCFVTFNEHTSDVTDIKFANNRKFLVSSSLDGTVRAFDMTR